MATNKKHVLKRLLSLTLVVVMCFGLLPTPAQAVTKTADQPITVDHVLALIEEYRNGKEPGEKAKEAGFTSYTNGSKYDPYNPKYNLNPFGNGIECAKFAFAFWEDLFGDAPMHEVNDASQVRPGDLIQFKNHWSIAVTEPYWIDGYQHPCIMTVGGGSAGEIGWGSIDEGLNFSSTLVSIHSKYPN